MILNVWKKFDDVKPEKGKNIVWHYKNGYCSGLVLGYYNDYGLKEHKSEVNFDPFAEITIWAYEDDLIRQADLMMEAF